MRAEGGEGGVDCNDSLTKLACELDSEDCPAACKANNNETDDNGEVVKSGDLAVTAKAASDRKAIIDAVSDLDTLTFKTSEEVTISKVVLERYGYSKGADVEKVWLEDEDGNEITTRKAVNSRDQVELSFKKEYKVVDGSVNATVVVKLADEVTPSGTIGFKIISAESTAKNQELNLDGYTPYTYDMVGYDAVRVSIDAKGTSKDYNYEEGTMYEVAKFKLKAGTSPLLVNGVTLTNEYDGDKTLDMKDFLDKVEVLVNGEKIDGVKFNVNKKNELNISFNDVEVAAKENATFTVNISLAGFDEYGAGVQFVIKAESDVKIQEKKTGARVSVITPEPGQDEEYNDLWAYHKFVGSKIKLSNTKLGNVEYAAGSSDVVVAEGTITLAESVELKDDTYVVTATYEGNEGKDVIEEMKLVIAGEEFDVEKTYEDGANTATFTFNDIVIEKGGKFQIKVDIDRDAEEGAIVTFDPAFDEDAFVGATYPDGDDSKVEADEISGTIGFASRLTVQASKAALTNDYKTDAEFKDNETSEEVTVLEGKYTSKKGNVSLTDFAVKASDELDLEGNNSTITFYLYIDGSKTSVADVKIKDGKLEVSDSFPNVKVTAGESVDVKVTAEVNAKSLIAADETELDLGKFTITLSGEDEEGNPAGNAPRKTVNLKIVKAGSIVVDETSKDKTILLAGNQTELASLTVKPDGAATELETLAFTVKGAGSDEWTTATLDNVLKVEIDGVDVVEDGYCSVEAADAEGEGDEGEGDEAEATGVQVVCDKMAEKVDSKTTILISLEDDDDANGDVELTVSQINNDTDVNKEFKKKFVKALVKVSKQEFTRLETTFTFSVEKKSGYDAKGLTIWAYDNEATEKNEASCTVKVYADDATIATTNNSHVDLQNKSESQEICKIEYAQKTGEPVEIEKWEYPDYFKNISTTGGEKSSMALMVNDNQK